MSIATNDNEIVKKHTQEYLDSNQYTEVNIKHYEILFGKTFVSTGGKATTKEFVGMLNLSAGSRVLDIGCGIGGSAFYIAENCQAHVLGVDLSGNMISNAEKYQSEMEKAVKDNVEFKIADVTEIEFEDNSFDCIYSRETIIYIQDKESLFSKFLKWVKPGGRLLISDYCYGTKSDKSSGFLSYVENRSYHMRTVEEYGKILNHVGFRDILAEDRTNQCIKILQNDLNRMLRDKHEILNEVTRSEYDKMVSAWELKLERCKSGDQAWGLFLARK